MVGTVQRIGQYYVLRFERRYNHRVERVWRAVSLGMRNVGLHVRVLVE